VQVLLAHAITNIIHWVQGHYHIPGNEEASCQTKLDRDGSGRLARQLPYSLASNGARQISERRSSAKANWEADKCYKHFSYRLNGERGTKRPGR